MTYDLCAIWRVSDQIKQGRIGAGCREHPVMTAPRTAGTVASGDLPPGRRLRSTLPLRHRREYGTPSRRFCRRSRSVSAGKSSSWAAGSRSEGRRACNRRVDAPGGPFRGTACGRTGARVNPGGFSNTGAGSAKASTAATTLSIPVPRSSQMFRRRIRDASFSFRERGCESRKRCVSTSGSPGLLISRRRSNISIIGPAPVIVKSWWIRALATSSRMATGGNIGISRRNAGPSTSLDGVQAWT